MNQVNQFNLFFSRGISNWGMFFSRGVSIALVGLTVGLVFAMYMIMATLSPDAQAIAAIGTAFVLYMCVEKLTRDPLMVFTGVFYLSLVGGLGVSAILSGLPDDIVAYIVIWVPSLWMIGLFVMLTVLKLGMSSFIRLMSRLDSETENPTEDSTTGIIYNP